MGFFNRNKRKKYTPPPPPSDELKATVSREEVESSQQLEEVHSKDADIDQRSDKILRIQLDNSLGPRFWLAVGHRKN